MRSQGTAIRTITVILAYSYACHKISCFYPTHFLYINSETCTSSEFILR